MSEDRASAAPAIQIQLLGSFALRVDGDPVELPAGAQHLVALLALRGRTGRSRLAGLLWPDTFEQRALASLRTGIWRVNQAAARLVLTAHGTVELGLDADIDVSRLIARSRDILGGADTGLDLADPGVGSGVLLADWDFPWLDAERERLHQLRLHVLEATARRLTDTGHFGLALEAALAALRADDLRESAHRAVISIHLAEGNLGEAKRAYEQCRRTLDEELGVEPTQATTAMIATARSRRPAPRLAAAPRAVAALR